MPPITRTSDLFRNAQSAATRLVFSLLLGLLPQRGWPSLCVPKLRFFQFGERTGHAVALVMVKNPTTTHHRAFVGILERVVLRDLAPRVLASIGDDTIPTKAVHSIPEFFLPEEDLVEQIAALVWAGGADPDNGIALGSAILRRWNLCLGAFQENAVVELVELVTAKLLERRKLGSVDLGPLLGKITWEQRTALREVATSIQEIIDDQGLVKAPMIMGVHPRSEANGDRVEEVLS